MSKPLSVNLLSIDNQIELQTYGQTTYGNYIYRLIQTDYKTYGKSFVEKLGRSILG